MRPRPSLLTRALEPLTSGLWVLFVVVSLFIGAIWSSGFGDAQLSHWVLNRGLFVTLRWLLQHLDFLWITLAATIAYLGLATDEGLNTARRWGLMIAGAVIALAWVSSRTGFPLGPIQYGGLLGARLGSVPLGLPLFWFTVIVGARAGVLHFFPRWSYRRVALGTGVIAALTDLHIEPLAAKLRGFWFWRSGAPALPPIFEAPLTGSVAWGLLATLLALAMREKSVVTSARPWPWQPTATLAIFHFVFLAAHLGRWMRG